MAVFLGQYVDQPNEFFLVSAPDERSAREYVRQHGTWKPFSLQESDMDGFVKFRARAAPGTERKTAALVTGPTEDALFVFTESSLDEAFLRDSIREMRNDLGLPPEHPPNDDDEEPW